MLKTYHLILVIAGLLIFSYFIQYPIPYKLIGISGLAISSIIMSLDKNLFEHLFGKKKKPAIFYSCMFIGLLLGLLIPIILRKNSQLTPLPHSFTNFIWVAILIGMTEELVFRGWIQSVLSTQNKYSALLFSSIAHAAFKAILFISDEVQFEVDITHLFMYTFYAGIILSILKFWSGNVWPAVLAHVLFDIIIYGDVEKWPWWVI